MRKLNINMKPIFSIIQFLEWDLPSYFIVNQFHAWDSRWAMKVPNMAHGGTFSCVALLLSWQQVDCLKMDADCPKKKYWFCCLDIPLVLSSREKWAFERTKTLHAGREQCVVHFGEEVFFASSNYLLKTRESWPINCEGRT